MSNLLFYLMVFILTISDNSAKDVPGLDFLASGFDAIKMISNNEDVKTTDRSRFRLFDLTSDRDGIPFHLDANGFIQTFKTPSVVQVTNINMRTKVSVASVSYTYTEFFHSYFSSYSFEVGISLGPATAALGYHKTLENAYQKITKDQVAVGISTDWWGMFSITLAPAFVLTFDPIFNRTLSKLSANPTSETDQMYYNQLITSFGTHYISSIVLGGVVNMFTQVTSQYQEEHSKQSISESISLSFGYQKNQLSGSIGWGDESSNVSETFRKNSQLEMKFLPAIPADLEATNISWNIWLNRTAVTPVVVNRTLSPITNLLIESPPEVHRHLQLTMDHYLQNGTLPSFEQLSMAGRRRKKRAISDLETVLIPGVDVVGCGYDIFSLKSKSCLFDMTTQDNETWVDVFNDRAKYQIPDGYFLTGNKDSLSMSDTVFFDTYKEFITDSTYSSSHDSAGFLGFGASSENQQTRIRYSRFYQHKYRMAWTKRQFIWFTLAVASFPTPKFNAATRLILTRLPTTFDSDNTTANYQKWQSFFDSYGTHYVVRADMGGMFWAEDYFESCLITKMTETWIRREITKRYWFFTKKEIEIGYDKQVSEEYQKNSIAQFKIIGGLTSIFPLNFDNWVPTIKDTPSPVTYRLQPIYTLLPKGAQRDAMEAASFFFRSAMNNSSNLYIERLQSETSPPILPQYPCTEKRKKRQEVVNPRNNPFLSGLKSARSALCPIIGFSGSFCPGEQPRNVTTNSSALPPQKSRSMDPLTLPTVAGMAIDISTGDILLPALQFTDSASKTWTDPDSGQVFYVPTEVDLVPGSLKDNTVSVSIFNTENELVDVWIRGYEAGRWSGGQFARTRNISDVYNSFFKDNQATSIAQDLKVLYTATVPQDKLKLNRYAQQAIDQLTASYDESLYNDFMDVWGTHVTVSNKVGGMTEQQVIFKNCMVNTTNFTDGISRSKLKYNLEQELLNPRPCLDSYYWYRRKKLIDHRIGGNILLINNTAEWQQTIVLAPALLSIVNYIPWDELVQNETIKANLKRAIIQRFNQTAVNRQLLAEKIRMEHANMQLKAQLYIGYLMTVPNDTQMNYFAGDSVALSGSEQCGTGIESLAQFTKLCSIPQQKTGACAITINNGGGKDTIDITTSVPVSYERNRTTGAFRIVTRRQFGRLLNRSVEQPDRIPFRNYDIEGDWVNIGCSVIDNQCITRSAAFGTVADVKKLYLCSGCTVICATKTDCNCFCPQYEQDPQDEPYAPYCKK